MNPELRQYPTYDCPMAVTGLDDLPPFDPTNQRGGYMDLRCPNATGEHIDLLRAWLEEQLPDRGVSAKLLDGRSRRVTDRSKVVQTIDALDGAEPTRKNDLATVDLSWGGQRQAA